MRRNVNSADVWGLREFIGRDPFGYGFPMTQFVFSAGSSSTNASANRAHFYRVVGGGTISKIAVNVTVQSGNICVGVYSNAGAGRAALPSTLLATSGAVACPAAGYNEIALGASVTVAPGDWLAFSCDNTTATFGTGNIIGVTNLYSGLVHAQDTAHPLPSTAAPAQIGGRGFALIGIP